MSATARTVWSPIVKATLASLGMALGVYLFLGFFSGIESKTRWIASLGFLAFGALGTAIVAINAYLSRKEEQSGQ
jgi:hypothetical protein